MNRAISLETVDNDYLIKLDKNLIDRDVLIDLIEYIRMEYLIRKADFDKDVEEIGEEIKAEWWEKNKERFIESQGPNIEEGEAI